MSPYIYPRKQKPFPQILFSYRFSRSLINHVTSSFNSPPARLQRNLSLHFYANHLFIALPQTPPNTTSPTRSPPSSLSQQPPPHQPHTTMAPPTQRTSAQDDASPSPPEYSSSSDSDERPQIISCGPPCRAHPVPPTPVMYAWYRHLEYRPFQPAPPQSAASSAAEAFRQDAMSVLRSGEALAGFNARYGPALVGTVPHGVAGAQV
ncbi:hypothetical protein BU23DRAFT_121536 [Bimuria novae-zelandiae CBS 107.79]|uniref:Uncharacterized protein n=1 Tax=Bimuria novae-zelandiae CBS 107.79 TaxID=1447943 RepID=A0A6A5V9D7_9PLEO|nr:hypothetical protein BU23DRAFT_121536 [Bimuria novae-zelandiae CBS 107.79]